MELNQILQSERKAVETRLFVPPVHGEDACCLDVIMHAVNFVLERV